MSDPKATMDYATPSDKRPSGGDDLRAVIVTLLRLMLPIAILLVLALIVGTILIPVSH